MHPYTQFQVSFRRYRAGRSANNHHGAPSPALSSLLTPLPLFPFPVALPRPPFPPLPLEVDPFYCGYRGLGERFSLVGFDLLGFRSSGPTPLPRPLSRRNGLMDRCKLD